MVHCFISLAANHPFYGIQPEAAQAIIDIIITATTDGK